MEVDRRTPGIYREEAFVRAPEDLPTGVPAFVGLGFAFDRNKQTLPPTKPEPQELLHVSQLAARWTPRASGDTFLEAAVKGFFANGGTRCYVVGAGDPGPPSGDGGAGMLLAAIQTQLPHIDVDLVAVPDAMALPQDDLG